MGKIRRRCCRRIVRYCPKEKEEKKVEVNEQILEIVTGGGEPGYWDVICTACNTPIDGAGIACYTWEKLEYKLGE